MFGLDKIRAWIYDTDAWLTGWEHPPFGKAKAYSLLAIVKELRDWQEKYGKDVAAWADGVRPDAMTHGMADFMRPLNKPPINDRLRAIEDALGITYEFEDKRPAKWVAKKAKKR